MVVWQGTVIYIQPVAKQTLSYPYCLTDICITNGLYSVDCHSMVTKLLSDEL